jgi:hypothetical protein
MPKYATISQGLLDVKRQSIDQQVNNKCNQNFNHVLAILWFAAGIMSYFLFHGIKL